MSWGWSAKITTHPQRRRGGKDRPNAKCLVFGWNEGLMKSLLVRIFLSSSRTLRDLHWDHTDVWLRHKRCTSTASSSSTHNYVNCYFVTPFQPHLCHLLVAHLSFAHSWHCGVPRPKSLQGGSTAFFQWPQILFHVQKIQTFRQCIPKRKTIQSMAWH